MVTDIVFAPLEVATKYQISVSTLLLRVLVAFVNAPPFHEADPIEPVPATFCAILAVSTMVALAPVTECVHVFVVVPLVAVVILVEVASNAIVEVDEVPPELVDEAAVSTVAKSTPFPKMCLVVVAFVIALYSVLGKNVVVEPSVSVTRLS
jgi:hypothetical protein